MLGIGGVCTVLVATLGAGRVRNARVAKGRVAKFRARLGSFRILKRADGEHGQGLEDRWHCMSGVANMAACWLGVDKKYFVFKHSFALKLKFFLVISV